MSTKFILAIVSNEDSGRVQEALVAHQYAVTRMSSTGGFLRRGNDTFLIGADDAEVSSVLDVIRFACQGDPQPDEHHATIFVLDAESFEQI